MILSKIQSELKAPKNQFNKFGNYNYRSCEDIVEALKPLLNKYKVALTMSDEVVEVGSRIYIKATVSLIGEDNTKIAETTAYAREEETKKGMTEAQITGSSSSYARKYALNGLLAIDDTKDDDFANAQDKTSETKATAQKTTMATESQINIIQELALKKGSKIADIKKHYKVKELKDMSLVQASQCIEMLNNKEDK